MSPTAVIERIRAGLRVNRGPGMSMMLPFIGLVAVAFASSAVILTSLVMKIDERATAYRKEVLNGAIQREQHSLRDAAFAMARRDDLATLVYTSGESNIWEGLPCLDLCYVIDGRGRTLWAKGGEGQRPMPLSEVSPVAVGHLSGALPKNIAEARRLETALPLLAAYGDVPSMMSAMPLVPLSSARQLPDADLRYVVLIRRLGSDKLDEWERVYRLEGLEWQPSSTGSGSAGYLPLVDEAGNYLGSIGWPGYVGGSKALADIMPLLAVCSIVFGTLSLWLILLIHRSRTALETSGRLARLAAEEATRNAEQAEQARAEAEAALLQAEEARHRADAIARRESAEQALHREQLRENSHMIAASLKDSMSSLVKQLLEMAADLELSAEMTMSTIHEQQQHADTVRRQAHESVGAIQAIIGGIVELTASIGEIRRAADESRQSALTASDRSAQARKANTHLLDQVNSISDATSSISAIAKQTNLLALNATIEAARAGESGYGFAVVAGEVKALATQTAQLTSSIHDRVGGIEAAARSTVDIVGTVDEILEALVGSMAESSATVQQQQVVANDIQRNSHEVADTAQTADRAIEAISRSLDGVAQAATSTRQIGAAVRHRAEHLNAEFARLVAQLEAA